ncbi:Cysteine-rich receptor-like protein kinase 10 [Forsythia ovata]|uniref:non-specific serine/threonine protein kinase n=1 Tax=Forsythia ovata TaxID=205694 RepID=A0ABD1R6G1_9LAMI
MVITQVIAPTELTYTLLSSVSSNIDSNGFYNTSIGDIPDRVYSIALCRGDVQLDTCRSCINNATRTILQLCPYQKKAILWDRSDKCMIRYSNNYIFGTLETFPQFYGWNVKNVTSKEEFNKDLKTLLDSLRSQAAYGGSLKKFAAAIGTGPDILTIYGLEQCTPDLTSDDYVQADNEISTVETLHYDFGTIRAATDNFSDANKLGQGGFGIVYKGKLPNGQKIAVKRLSMNSGQGDVEFKNEVVLVARLQHRNLVRLLGFSLQGSERLLIYEFVNNGSLDHFLFGNILFEANNIFYNKLATRIQLSDHVWIGIDATNIIGGVARGILYLHEDSRLRIIHRDLKAGNVLLDEEMNAKISDFGMARLFGQDQTQGNTSRVVGTYGYMAPEYALHGQFSSKSDVFSFGVLVLEIISGQKINSFQNGENVEDLLSCAWENWHWRNSSKCNRSRIEDLLRILA